MKTHPHLWENRKAIPVSVPITYDALLQAAVKGKSVGCELACPGCGLKGSLLYTGGLVERDSYWPASGGIEDRWTPVPMCCCEACRRRFRVLPVEIPPFKRYTLAVIETGCSAYTDPDLPRLSLEKAVNHMGHGHPHRSALHGWCGGLGERALGRLDRFAGYLPVSALMAETGKSFETHLFDPWEKTAAVAPGKYRSVKRQEQLEACVRVFAAARRLFPESSHALWAWEAWLQKRFHVAAWVFPARFSCTAFQQQGPGGPSVQSAPWITNPREQRKGRNHGARSPP